MAPSASGSCLSSTRSFARSQTVTGGVSVADLKQAIEEFMHTWNANPKPFIWTATVEDIIKKIDRARAKLEQIKPGSTLPRGNKKVANL